MIFFNFNWRYEIEYHFIHFLHTVCFKNLIDNGLRVFFCRLIQKWHEKNQSCLRYYILWELNNIFENFHINNVHWHNCNMFHQTCSVTFPQYLEYYSPTLWNSFLSVSIKSLNTIPEFHRRRILIISINISAVYCIHPQY